ncbi:transcriptional regulator, TetR family [Amycolatopsis marina]|uniref:Transcriptional regulator, TetR family n=1 Tax=Amycolatopsis marina TaxID=490629 RepID=A0A1I0WZF5_9PSEU|nr:TetR/AcrR family transcriptional regulator [Amycolatopsis marina]SFA93518.1 transcriptional regulator, TetR family [Amycolatopsis marina]
MGEQERAAQQLPPGRHGLPRDYVAGNQRARILTAVPRVVAETGYGEMTVEAVISRAGISRRTFYQHFSKKEDAFLAAYDAFAALVVERVEQAQRSSGTEFSQLAEAALRAVLELLAEHPAEAHMLIVEVLAAGPKAIERRNASLRLIIGLVHETTCAIAEAQGAPPSPEITAETVVGGLVEVVYSRIHRGETTQLPELLPDLVYCALLPYIGPTAAAVEHQRLADQYAEH